MLLLTTFGCFIQAWVVDDTIDITGEINRVDAAVGSGDLSFSAGDTLSIGRRIEYSGEEEDQPEATALIANGVLTLTDDCDDLRLICVVDWTVVLPAAADLELSTGSGDISADGDYVSLHLETGSGDIDASLGDSATSAWAMSGSGDLDLSVAGGAWAIAADTGSGDITLSDVQDDAGANRTLSLETGSGDITVAGR